jgi:predicted XRE-type DNA-binding protein
MLTDLTPCLREELQRLALPLTRHTGLSAAELRLAHAQLVGWLQGLLQTAHTAVFDPNTLAANGSETVYAAPNRLDRANTGPCSLTTTPRDDSAPNKDNSAIRSARQTLITAINKHITQQRLTAAQAAAVLHLTGPRVTQLLHANLDEFTLDELVNLLPALQLTIHVVPAPEQNLRSSG